MALKRSLRDLGLAERGAGFELRGKRVLVVAQKEDPLRVLRDGLPAEVQAVAGECLKRGRLGLAVVGPLKDEAKIQSWLR